MLSRIWNALKLIGITLLSFVLISIGIMNLVPVMQDTEKFVFPNINPENNGVDPIFPHTTWHHVRPCGEYFDEQREFQTALQCASRVWPEIKDVGLVIPRCFVVTVASPDVFTSPDQYNLDPVKFGNNIAGVLGKYQTETRTVFVVENVDMAEVYRHELQHYFLNFEDPESGGAGHDQVIWQLCQPPKHAPSPKARLIGKLRYH